MVELTEAEQRAIAQLQRACAKAKRCGLKLFSASGTLCVLKVKDGKDYDVGRLNICNDGGDPDWREDEDGCYIDSI